MIKNALSVMPARPVLYIVPVIVVLVLSFYYWDKYSRCTSNKQFRSSLNELLHAEDSDALFRLSDITGFMWDRVRIVTNFEPESNTGHCPFGWNWPTGDRDKLIASGLLTVLIFVDKGTMVEVLELSGDEVAFHGADASLKPQAAVFSIATNSENSAGVALTLSK
ncbi:MAG: hypothetical protein GY896_07570 [Gammaproteobacteria bacterium]|nr:hypothetical protein [Gammaproteobacteria bacterium]